MKKIFILLLLFILPIPGVFAHPHIYIDLIIEIDIDEQGITGFWENWTIVREFGENIIIDYDKDNNGIFDEKETKTVRAELFDNIINYHYYTYLDIADTVYIPSEIKNFSVHKVAENTVFRFFIPCRIFSGEAGRTFKLSIIDWTKYVSFGLRYIDDPSTRSVRYNVSIDHYDDYYSHSSIFGNSNIVITMNQTEQSGKNALPTAASRSRMIKLTPENAAPTETITNPFISAGVKIKDDNPNPFVTY